MKFTLYAYDGKVRRLSAREARALLTERQYQEAMQGTDDPLEELSFMVSGGILAVE